MTRVRIGALDVTVIDMARGREVFIDWRIADLKRRWRLTLAWHDLFVLFSERHGHKPGPRRFRIGPLRCSWYARGCDA